MVTQENIAATITTGKVEEDKRKPGQNLTVSVSRIDENKAMLKIVYHETKIAGQSPLTIREIDLSDRVEVKFGKTIHQRLAVTSLTDQTWAEITVRKANP